MPRFVNMDSEVLRTGAKSSTFVTTTRCHLVLLVKANLMRTTWGSLLARTVKAQAVLAPPFASQTSLAQLSCAWQQPDLTTAVSCG